MSRPDIISIEHEEILKKLIEVYNAVDPNHVKCDNCRTRFNSDYFATFRHCPLCRKGKLK